MARDAFHFSHRLRVRWAEIDGQNVVFNGHYLTYFDVAVTEYWRALGWTYAERFTERGVDTFAVKATLEYKSPARFDDELDVLVRVSRFGRTSLALAFEIHRDADFLVQGELVYVFVDVTERRPVPIPPEIQQSITAYEITAPERG